MNEWLAAGVYFTSAKPRVLLRCFHQHEAPGGGRSLVSLYSCIEKAECGVGPEVLQCNWPGWCEMVMLE